ncbi:hypothetical protein CMV_027869, partial [Castanea mollissima]
LGALKGDICFKAITTSCLVNSPQSRVFISAVTKHGAA